MKREIAKLRQHSEGAVAVEAAICLPLLILMIVGIIEFAVAFWQWNTLLLVVDQVGRYVMINNNPAINATCDTSCAKSYLQTLLPSSSVCTTPTVNQTCVNATSDGTNMTVAAYYGFGFLAVTGSFTISSGIKVPLD